MQGPPKRRRPSPKHKQEPKANKDGTRFKQSRARNAAPPPKGTKSVDTVGARLNKYVAQCGVASRRQAAEFVKEGLVAVNGKVIKEPGYQIQKGDQVSFRGQPIQPEERQLYILLNKPRGLITTVKDERDRETVIDGFGDAIPERIFPVGRLDRETSGLLLLTNDGALAKQLTHPSFGVSKIYKVGLNKALTKRDMEQIAKGVDLEDGFAEVDWVNFENPDDRKQVTLELHSGRNRIIRRIFAHLGYQVKKLDRVYFAGLTKKDLPRGYYRYLSNKEVVMLRHFSKTKKKKAKK